MLKPLCFGVMFYKQKLADTFFPPNNREKVEYQNMKQFRYAKFFK